MDLKQLQYFVRIVELKSFTRAAKQLRIAQPALGLQIRNLEAEFETQLLVRHSRGVEPTQAGLILFKQARELLGDAANIKHLLQEFKGAPRGKLALGIGPSLNDEFSCELVMRCARDLPEISLNLVQERSATLMERIRDDRLDLACITRLEDTGLIWEPLFEYDLYFVGVPHVPESDNKPITFFDVASHPLILPNATDSSRRRLDDIAKRVGLPIHVTCEVDSYLLARELAKHSVGYTILPYSLAQRDIEDGTLVARRIVEPIITIETGTAYKERRPLSIAASAVRALIQNLVKEHIALSDGMWRTRVHD